MEKQGNAARCKKYKNKKKQDPAYLEKERIRGREARTRKKEQMSEQEKIVQREKEKIRKQKHRAKKALHCDQVDTYNPTPQALGKAVQRVMRSLPRSHRKVFPVVHGLAEKVGLKLTSHMESALNPKQLISKNALPQDTCNLIEAFYFKPDVCYTAPGMKDEVTIWINGKKEKLRKHYLTMYLKEAYFMFTELYPDNYVGFSKFCQLHPKNVLLLKDSPVDQCRCKTHENLFLKLKALQVNYDSRLWAKMLCDSTINSCCWQGNCETCSEGNNIFNVLCEEIVSNMDKDVYWKQWVFEAADEKHKKLIIKTHETSYGELVETFKKDFKSVVVHINTKHIQAADFEKDTKSQHTRVLQVDFAMNYSCEYQSEVQSALWSRASVTLFTAALLHNGKCQTYLICSNTQEKDKDAIACFLYHLYEQYIMKNDTDVAVEVIWSDGPTSEFKNRFMVCLLQQLSSKFHKKFVWKYSATSHGKGIVDGVGGRAKSLVRQRVMSKANNCVVQSSEDFCRVAQSAMEKTIIIHISHSDISHFKAVNDWWTDVEPVPGILKMHIISVNLENYTATLYMNALSGEASVTVRCPTGLQQSVKVGQLKAGEWCKVQYGNQCFPGEVTDVDGVDLKVSVMVRSGQHFNWPTPVDEIYYAPADVLCRIKPPVVVGSGSRCLFAFEDFE